LGLLGAHVSIRGGIERSIQRGTELGCESIQIFTKNQRQWSVSSLSEKTVEDFLQERERSGIKEIIVHDSYLINLGNPDPAALKKSREAFYNELVRADQLQVPYLVFHPGACMDSTQSEGVRRIAESLNLVINIQQKGSVQLLLETTSGQGSHLGYSFEQLATILSQVEEKRRVGICFDTAHVFTAGYDLRSERSYNQTFELFQSIIGLDCLKVFHLNDSKKQFGSHLDRHENIGEGYLGLEPFRLLVNDPRFQNHSMILETPGSEDCYRKNLSQLRSLRKN
jgi:deoxyribonuclease-4